MKKRNNLKCQNEFQQYSNTIIIYLGICNVSKNSDVQASEGRHGDGHALPLRRELRAAGLHVPAPAGLHAGPGHAEGVRNFARGKFIH